VKEVMMIGRTWCFKEMAEVIGRIQDEMRNLRSELRGNDGDGERENLIRIVTANSAKRRKRYIIASYKWNSILFLNQNIRQNKINSLCQSAF
jgi:hypothetical protein